MTDRTRALLAALERNAPPEPGALSKALAELPVDLPRDYVEAMTESSGFRGFLSDASPYIDLWPIEKLLALNAGYEVSPERDEMLLIGSDGGGTAFAIVRFRDRRSFADVPFIPLKVSEARLRGESFEEFLGDLAQGGHLA